MCGNFGGGSGGGRTLGRGLAEGRSLGRDRNRRGLELPEPVFGARDGEPMSQGDEEDHGRTGGSGDRCGGGDPEGCDGAGATEGQ